MSEIVSIDLETLSTAPNAVVLSLGVYCDSFEYEAFLNVDEQIKAGADVSWDTLAWWMNQPDESRKEQVNVRRDLTIARALTYLAFKLKNQIDTDCIIVSNPASFDLAILRWHWLRLGLPAPWPHWEERCYRTYRAQIDLDKRRQYEVEALAAYPGAQHSALVDAKRQHYVLSAARADGLVIR